MPVMFFSLAAWRLYKELDWQSRIRKPGLLDRFGRQLIMLIIVVGVFNSYGTLVGRDAGVALLVLLAGMKLQELQGERDYYIGSFIGMFLILTNFFYSQTILSALHMLLTIIIIVTALISLNDGKSFLNSQKRLKTASSLLFQSLPLLLILFVLFPRIDGPLWGLPKDARAGTTGLDDEMSPGQISQLSLSDKIAFRVEFTGDIPENASLYWRGPVLWHSDGVKWVGEKSRFNPAPVEVQGKPVKYVVTMEATDKNWLYGLEMPTTPPDNAFFSHDMQILTRSSIQARRRYALSSFTQFKLSARDQSELQQALQLPQGYHPRAVALGESWRDEGKVGREIVETALQMFNKEAFYYTLNPPLMIDDNVDQFIFEEQQGFCEHYAASFVILMRAAGLPARVVTGYQGGQLNPVGNYLVVRQHDAHAWAEVWLKEEGWVRIDPTSAVSPQRIIEGIDKALPENFIDIPLGLQNNKMAQEIWRRFSHNLDVINMRWNQWVLGYNNQRQSLFLNRIGFSNVNWRALTSWLLLLSTLVLVSVAFNVFKNRRAQTDEARLLYDRFCKKLGHCGIQRQASEGPRDFAHRAASERKDLTEHINKISELYISSRYRDRKELLITLREQIKAFKPARHSKTQKTEITSNHGRVTN
ncbi:MAG: transglutaminase-like putative cysteine protease [Gammaproteobacteria bacterium]|jgi:transglutaminase-like putative cysteine protease